MFVSLSSVIHFLVWLAVKVFFREVRVYGTEKVPQKGPVIYVCGPHANQFFDGALVAFFAPRSPSFLAAASSIKRKFVGTLLKQFKVIPVVRPQDNAKRGQGSLRRGKDTLVHGDGTMDLSSIGKGSSLKIGHEVVSILSVIGASTLELEHTPSCLDKDASTDDWKIVPRVDHRDMFSSVWKELGAGRSIAIFPEGGSHDQAHLLDLKVGVAIMALGAMASSDQKVTIVPIGINYFAPEQFRSKAFLEIGDGFQVDSALAEAYARGGKDKREACSSLMKQIRDELENVTVNVEHKEMLELLRMVKKVYTPAHLRLPPHVSAELLRRFSKGFETYREEPRVQELETQVRSYHHQLDALNLRDHQVNPLAKLERTTTLAIIVYRLIYVALLSLFVIPGLLVSFPAAIICNSIAAHKAKLAVQSSTVKLAGKDVLATWKVLVAFIVLPILYTLDSIVLCALACRITPAACSRDGIAFGIVFALLVMLVCPLLGYASIRFGENAVASLRTIPALLLALSKDKGTIRDLKEQREQIRDNLLAVVDTFGPQMMEGFEEQRIVSRFLNKRR